LHSETIKEFVYHFNSHGYHRLKKIQSKFHIFVCFLFVLQQERDGEIKFACVCVCNMVFPSGSPIRDM